MRIAMAWLIVALSGIVQAADLTPQQFIDRLKAVNPVDRVMPSGTIEYTMEFSSQHGVEAAIIVEDVTLQYNADCALVEKQLRVYSLPELEEDKYRIKTSQRAAITADTFTTWNAGDSYFRVLLQRNNLSKSGPICAGVLTTKELAALSAQDLTITGNSCSGRQGDRSIALTCDADGRLVQIDRTTKDAEEHTSASNFTLVGGKWVARDVTIARTKYTANATSVIHLSRGSFSPAAWTDEELTIIGTEGLGKEVYDCRGDGSPKLVSRTKSEISSDSSNSQGLVGRPTATRPLHQAIGFNCNNEYYGNIFNCCEKNCMWRGIYKCYWTCYPSVWWASCIYDYCVTFTKWYYCYPTLEYCVYWDDCVHDPLLYEEYYSMVCKWCPD